MTKRASATAAAEYKRHYMRERYRRRKASGQCIECGGPREPADGVRCGYCGDVNQSVQLAYRHTARHRWLDRQRRKRKREERRAEGLCAKCSEPSGEHYYCARHHAYNVSATRAWKERKRQGTAAEPRRRAEPRVDLSERYQPIDERVQSMRVRVLRALYWLSVGGEWSDSREIFNAASVESDPSSTERNTAQVMLGRLVKLGLAEHRVTRLSEWRDYRITHAGRAEVRRWRTGELPAVRGRRRSA